MRFTSALLALGITAAVSATPAPIRWSNETTVPVVLPPSSVGVIIVHNAVEILENWVAKDLKLIDAALTSSFPIQSVIVAVSKLELASVAKLVASTAKIIRSSPVSALNPTDVATLHDSMDTASDIVDSIETTIDSIADKVTRGSKKSLRATLSAVEASVKSLSDAISDFGTSTVTVTKQIPASAIPIKVAATKIEDLVEKVATFVELVLKW